MAERAGDDLSFALRLAGNCGYPWAERDALVLLSEVNGIIGQTEKADICCRRAVILSRRLADT
jgi:hypothetical protein